MKRSAPITLFALSLALAASSCASTDRPGSYATELARLEESCRARGGILTPAEVGRPVGRPQTEYACRINDGGTRLRN
jgi:hypothetical protein